jgi:hypothetical protein
MEAIMASLNYRALLIFVYVSLCNCVEWNGPVSTTAPEHSSTGIAQAPKQAILRRQTYALSICGYESGQARKNSSLRISLD